jgi:hypothetical protein
MYKVSGSLLEGVLNFGRGTEALFLEIYLQAFAESLIYGY